MAKEVVQKMCVQNNQPNYSMNNQDEKNKYISNLYELIDLGGQPKRTMKIIRLYMNYICTLSPAQGPHTHRCCRRPPLSWLDQSRVLHGSKNET